MRRKVEAVDKCGIISQGEMAMYPTLVQQYPDVVYSWRGKYWIRLMNGEFVQAEKRGGAFRVARSVLEKRLDGDPQFQKLASVVV